MTSLELPLEERLSAGATREAACRTTSAGRQGSIVETRRGDVDLGRPAQHPGDAPFPVRCAGRDVLDEAARRAAVSSRLAR